MRELRSKENKVSEKNNNVVIHQHSVNKEARAKIKGQRPCIVWFTGLSGSGKSTLANGLEKRLWEKKKHTYLLDGDNLRSGLNRDLGFDEKDRKENIRRIGEVAALFVDAGLIVLSAFISPFAKDRDFVRGLVEVNEFIEIYVDTPLEICELRDPKGLYRKARSGEILDFTGIDSPYEAPKSPEIHLCPNKETLDNMVEKIVNYLETRGYLTYE